MKKIKDIVFIVLLTLLFCVPLVFFDFNTGHDGYFHMGRLMGINQGWDSGQIIPRIYPMYNLGFGYGIPLFYCDLYLYPFAFLYRLGLPLLTSFRLMLIFYSLLSIISIFVVSKKIFKKDLTIYLVSILYTFANYHLLNVYVRVALGEILVISFIPIVFYAFYKLFIKKEDAYILLGVGFSLLLLAHNISFVMYCLLFGLLLIIYTIVNFKDKTSLFNIYKTTIKGVVLALLLCSWYILPMFEQLLDTHFAFQDYSKYFYLERTYTSLTSLFNPEYYFVLDSTVNLQNFGIGLCLLLLPFMYLFVKKNRHMTILCIVTIIIWLCLFGIIPIHLSSLLTTIQYSFRIYILIFPLACFIIGYCIDVIEKRNIKYIISAVILILSLVGLYACFNNVYSNNETLINNDVNLEDYYQITRIEWREQGYNWTQLSGGEYIPESTWHNYVDDLRCVKVWSDEYNYDEVLYPYQYNEDATGFSFDYYSDDDVIMSVPKTWYKGYQAFIINEDGSWSKLNTYKKLYCALVAFDFPSGQHSVLVKYSGTMIQKVSPLISGLAIAFIVVKCLIIDKRKNINNI